MGHLGARELIWLKGVGADMTSRNAFVNPEPRFKAGDQVIVTGLGSHRGKDGVIREVLNHWGDFVYRYRVDFGDGTPTVFFGFELKLKEAWPAAS